MRAGLVPMVVVVLLASAGAGRAEYPIYDCAEYADEDQIKPIPTPKTPRTPIPDGTPQS